MTSRDPLVQLWWNMSLIIGTALMLDVVCHLTFKGKNPGMLCWNCVFCICISIDANGLKSVLMPFLLLFLKSICCMILYKLKLLVISCENWSICDSLVFKITTTKCPFHYRKICHSAKFSRAALAWWTSVLYGLIGCWPFYSFSHC